MEQTETQVQKRRSDKNTIKQTAIYAAVIILCLAVIVSANFDSLKKGEITVHFLASLGMGILLIVYMLFGFRKKGMRIGEFLIFISSFAVSFVFLIFAEDIKIPLWFLGPLCISALLDCSLGLFLAYFYILQLYHFIDTDAVFVERVSVFTVCTALCVIGNIAVRKFRSSVKLNFEKIVNNASDEISDLELAEQSSNYLETFASELNSKNVNEYDLNNSVVSQNEENREKLRDLVTKDEIDYSIYASEHSELLDRLKEVKKGVYIHSLRVATIAYRCCVKLKYNSKFAMAVGLYHEIGKTEDKDGQENTLTILKAAAFPETVINAVNEVNSKEELPFTSKEAFVVAISETVITTYLYLKKMAPNTSNKKIADGAMTKYMLNGRANNSGVSVKDCGEIKNFMLDFLNTMEKNSK